MTKIYLKKNEPKQVVKLSDGDLGIMKTIANGKVKKYQFHFENHDHASFFASGKITNGEKVRVESIDGPEEYQLLYQ